MTKNSHILYKTEATTTAGDPFLTIKQARGYYNYASRGGQDSIFFILYDSNTHKFGLINESKPPLDERQGSPVNLTTAFGGSIDMDLTYLEITKLEVAEEAGYEVPPSAITFMGSTMVSTQMDQIAYGYLVDITNIHKTLTAEYETENNQDYIVWMTYDEVIDNSDWKSIFLVSKLLAQIALKETHEN